MTAYKDVQEERTRQDAQWGGPDHDDTHDELDWLGFINKQIHTDVGVNVRGRLIKVAALALAGIESIDRKRCPGCGALAKRPDCNCCVGCGAYPCRCDPPREAQR